MAGKLTVIPFFVLSFSISRSQDPWKISTTNIDPSNYYGITVASGMIGIVSSPEPFKAKDVVLAGAYDLYGRGRVSNFLKSFNLLNMYLEIDGRRMDARSAGSLRQELDMKRASFTTSFSYGDKATVSYTYYSLRQLPYTVLMDVMVTAKKDISLTGASVMEAPDALAVHLCTNKSKVLGLIVPNISNMFNESFIAAAENEARKSGYSLMILQSGDNPVREAENLKLCKYYRVDGILISVAADSYSTDLFTRYSELVGIPLIFFDRVPDGGVFDTVCMADEEVATLAANTLIKYRKKNNFGLFGAEALSITKKRKEAFAKTLKAGDPKIKAELRYCNNSEEARQAVTAALKNEARPDLIFCMSDELLVGAITIE